MTDDGRQFVDDGVTEEETAGATEAVGDETTDFGIDEEEVEIPKVDAVLIDLEEFKRRAEAATTVDERMKFAKPFSLPTLGCEVMVAPSQGCEWFEKMFLDPQKMFGSGAGPDLADMDRVVIREFIISCTVQPKLDEPALDLLAKASSVEFGALAGFCLIISAKEPFERMADRLGAVDTEAYQHLFADVVGSMS